MTTLYINLSILVQREEGQDVVEYAVLLVFLTMAVIAAALLFGTRIGDVLIRIGDALTGA